MLKSEGSSDVPELDILFDEADHRIPSHTFYQAIKVAQIYVSNQVIQMWQ